MSIRSRFSRDEFRVLTNQKFLKVEKADRMLDDAVTAKNLIFWYISVGAAINLNRVAPSARSDEATSQQVVGFHLAGEEYGIQITKIQEIILPGEITRIPQVPHFIEGLINLRGSVIPIIDLRKPFNLPSSERTDQEPRDRGCQRRRENDWRRRGCGELRSSGSIAIRSNRLRRPFLRQATNISRGWRKSITAC